MTGARYRAELVAHVFGQRAQVRNERVPVIVVKAGFEYRRAHAEQFASWRAPDGDAQAHHAFIGFFVVDRVTPFSGLFEVGYQGVEACDGASGAGRERISVIQLGHFAVFEGSQHGLAGGRTTGGEPHPHFGAQPEWLSAIVAGEVYNLSANEGGQLHGFARSSGKGSGKPPELAHFVDAGQVCPGQLNEPPAESKTPVNAPDEPAFLERIENIRQGRFCRFQPTRKLRQRNRSWRIALELGQHPSGSQDRRRGLPATGAHGVCVYGHKNNFTRCVP